MFWFFGCEACGILTPWPRIEPTPPYTGRLSLNHWTTREVPRYYFQIIADSLRIKWDKQVGQSEDWFDSVRDTAATEHLDKTWKQTVVRDYYLLT